MVCPNLKVPHGLMAIDARNTCPVAVLLRSFAIQMQTRLTFPKVDFDTPNVHVTGLGRFRDVRLEESVVASGRLLSLWFPFDERLQSGKYRSEFEDACIIFGFQAFLPSFHLASRRTRFQKSGLVHGRSTQQTAQGVHSS